ncbi:type III-A CRISPR-associated RAMP protein Csm5 [candidate division KSB1 bacterium]
MKQYLIEGTVLSPVHIGSGEELNPFDYIIRDGVMIRFRLDELLSGLTGEEQGDFYRLNDDGDIGRLRKFIADRVDRQRHASYSTDVTKSVENQYMQKIDDIRNQLLIQPVIRDKYSSRPYIPGSSLKGALRTAIVSELAEDTPGLRKGDDSLKWNLELKVLHYGVQGGRGLRPVMGKDPFRAVKVRDMHLDSDSVSVAFVKNVSRGHDGRLQPGRGIPMVSEVIKGSVMGNTVKFSGELLFDNDLVSRHGALGRNDITPEFIVRACNAFYVPKVDEESEKFYERSTIQAASDELLKEVTSLANDECLIRIGRYSGCESVTVDTYRSPEFGGRRNVGGRSRNICEERYPMGWIKIRLSPEKK